MFEQQEKHFDAMRWLISSLFRDEDNNLAKAPSTKEDEDWEVIKKDPIFGEDGWVEVPRNV